MAAAFVRIAPKLEPGFAVRVRREIDSALGGAGTGDKLAAGARTATTELSRAATAARTVGSNLSTAATATGRFAAVGTSLDRAAASASRTRTSLDAAAGAGSRLSGAGQGLDTRFGRIRREVDATDTEVAQLDRSLDRMGTRGADSMQRLARGAAALVAARAGLGFFRGVVDAASDLDESISKSSNVFRQAQTQIEEFGETSAEAFGISRQQAFEMGSTFGNLLTSMGLSRQAAADLSVEMLKLGADLASFNNLSIDEALGKIRSGLVGEFEPLRSLGVTLNADAVAAKAVELGLADTAKAVDSAAKIQATYALIVEQTANAQGDFARTSEGMANSQRKLNAAWQEARAAIGTGLIPVAQQIVGTLTEMIPVVVDLADSFGGALGRGIESTLPTVRVFASALGTVAPLLDAIPGPLLTVVANLALIEKGFGRLGLEGVITGPIRRLTSNIKDTAVGGLDGLGNRMREKMTREIAQATPVVTAFDLAGSNVIQRVNTQAGNLGAAAASSFTSRVRSITAATPIFNFDVMSSGVIQRVNREAATLGQTATQAAAGTRTFSQSLSNLGANALPFVGVALGVSTAALGIWQQRRAEAAAAQAEWTAGMLADTEAMIANGELIAGEGAAIGEANLERSKARLLEKNRLDDINRITEALGSNSEELGGNASALDAYQQALESVARSGSTSTEEVQRFRRALLESEEVQLRLPASVREGSEAHQEIIEAYIREGAAIREQGVGIKGNIGLLNQFDSEVQRTADGFVQVNAAANEAVESTANFATSAGSIDILTKSTEDSRQAMLDAAKAADEYKAAIERLGEGTLSPVRAEEERQLATQAALEAFQPTVTAEDVSERQLDMAEATQKRADAQNALNEALAGGVSGTDLSELELALQRTIAAETEAQADLDAGLREVGGLTAQAIITGMDERSIDIREGVRSNVEAILAQAATIADTQGGQAAAAYWDKVIADTRTVYGPEFGLVFDNALAERGLAGKTGREILLEASVDVQLTPAAAELLTAAEFAEKTLDITVDRKGDFPDELVPLLTSKLGAEERRQFVLDVVANMEEGSTFDPAFWSDLDTEQRRSLVLDIAAQGDTTKLPFDEDTFRQLLKDEEFTRTLILTLAAQGAQIDDGTPLGKVVAQAVEGTPLELLVRPKVDPTEEEQKQLEGLNREMDTLRGYVEATQAAQDVTNPNFRGSISTLDQQLGGLTNTVRTYNDTPTDPKTARIDTPGKENLDGALRAMQNLRAEPNLEKTVTIGVFGQPALDLALRAVRELANPTPPRRVEPVLPLAGGGIFDQPQFAWIAEAGRELVLPLSMSQHDRAASLLEQAGVFQRFAAEFAASYGGAAVPAGPTTMSNRSVVNNIYTNDAGLVAQRVNEMLGENLVGAL